MESIAYLIVLLHGRIMTGATEIGELIEDSERLMLTKGLKLDPQTASRLSVEYRFGLQLPFLISSESPTTTIAEDRQDTFPYSCSSDFL